MDILCVFLMFFHSSNKLYICLFQVQVILTDVNDNPPVFSLLEYTVTVYETIAVGTDILQLFSTDADIEDNAVSYYYKIQGSGDFNGKWFSVVLFYNNGNNLVRANWWD